MSSQNRIKISKEYQVFLGKHLRYGDGLRIAKEVGTHPVYVSQILSGKRPAKTRTAEAVVLQAQKMIRSYIYEIQAELEMMQQTIVIHEEGSEVCI